MTFSFKNTVKLGYNELGYNERGYNERGYNELGYNEQGHNEVSSPKGPFSTFSNPVITNRGYKEQIWSVITVITEFDCSCF